MRSATHQDATGMRRWHRTGPKRPEDPRRWCGVRAWADGGSPRRCSPLVLLLLLIFILENGQRPDIGFFGAHGHLPLGIALLLAAILGVLLVVIPGTGRIIQQPGELADHRGRPHRHGLAALRGTLEHHRAGPAGDVPGSNREPRNRCSRSWAGTGERDGYPGRWAGSSVRGSGRASSLVPGIRELAA
jgi:uncharacterized integral membrane protein